MPCPAFGLGVVEPHEQQAFGVTREERAPWFEEALPLIRRLWSEDAVDHDGPRFHYEGVSIGTRPVQQPPDVWLGGRAPRELRRVGELADGWLPSFCTPATVAEGREQVEAAAAAAGRTIDDEHYGAMVFYARTEVPEPYASMVGARLGFDPGDVIVVGIPALRERLEDYLAVGFSKLVLVPVQEAESWRAEVEELADGLLDLQGTRSSSAPCSTLVDLQHQPATADVVDLQTERLDPVAQATQPRVDRAVAGHSVRPRGGAELAPAHHAAAAREQHADHPRLDRRQCGPAIAAPQHVELVEHGLGRARCQPLQSSDARAEITVVDRQAHPVGEPVPVGGRLGVRRHEQQPRLTDATTLLRLGSLLRPREDRHRSRERRLVPTRTRRVVDDTHRSLLHVGPGGAPGRRQIDGWE